MASKELYKTIYQIAKIINLSLKPSEVMEKIAEQVTVAMQAKGCFIRILDEKGEVLLPDAHYGLSDRYAEKGAVEVAKSALDQQVLKGEIVYIADASNDHRFQYKDEAAEEGLTSILVVPLTVGGDKIIGVVRVYANRIREFDVDELEFLTCISNLAGLALENARLYNNLKRASRLAEEYNYVVFED